MKISAYNCDYKLDPPDFYDDDYGDEDQDERSYYDDGEPYDFEVEERYSGYNCG